MEKVNRTIFLRQRKSPRRLPQSNFPWLFHLIPFSCRAIRLIYFEREDILKLVLSTFTFCYPALPKKGLMKMRNPVETPMQISSALFENHSRNLYRQKREIFFPQYFQRENVSGLSTNFSETECSHLYDSI